MPRNVEHQTRVVRYLVEHLRHEGFEPVDDDWGRTIGWRCACREEGWDVDVSQQWYNAVARFSGGAWGEYQAIRYERAAVLSREAARRMHEAFEAREARRKDDPAEQRANALLRRFLSKKQLAQLDEHGFFEQVGADGLLYRLWHGSHRSIELIEGGEVVKTLCIHPRITVPTGDVVLAQKLLVQGDVERLYKTANVTRRR